MCTSTRSRPPPPMLLLLPSSPLPLPLLLLLPSTYCGAIGGASILSSRVTLSPPSSSFWPPCSLPSHIAREDSVLPRRCFRRRHYPLFSAVEPLFVAVAVVLRDHSSSRQLFESLLYSSLCDMAMMFLLLPVALSLSLVFLRNELGPG